MITNKSLMRGASDFFFGKGGIVGIEPSDSIFPDQDQQSPVSVGP